METIPDSAPAARRLKLRLLICNPKSYGSKNIVVKGRGGDIPRTREDPYLPSLHSYECKTHNEWREIGVAISKQVSNQNCLFAFAHFVDLDQPAGAAARVDLVPGGIYGEGTSPVVVIDTTTTTEGPSAQYTLDCITATLTAYAGIPATAENLQECLDRITNAARGTVVKVIAETPTEHISPQMDEGSQSGSAGEALTEPESTLSTAATETRSGGAEETPPAVSVDAPEVIDAQPAKAPNSKPKPSARHTLAAKKK